MSYEHLSAEERGKIEAWLYDGISQTEIAKRLNRHRSTIFRELKRNSPKRINNSLASLPYRATSANNVAMLRKKNCGTVTNRDEMVSRANSECCEGCKGMSQ
ncbi:helix-turn-helix domain-containing protein [Brochothrix thermosphacta]|uniref:Transposase IS30-like HTH domain-containing protein n=1 Tax=Brochothrix thermosphacta TaxID=2756 RepID=A0A2X0QDR6_BROTH|nr:helix-turn-helix domain-containing protein [Brochothrix thermosphacta]SPP26904.1 hypothetical protein BTBSAS_120040 [Brochothrix thermosphacta]